MFLAPSAPRGQRMSSGGTPCSRQHDGYGLGRVCRWGLLVVLLAAGCARGGPLPAAGGPDTTRAGSASACSDSISDQTRRTASTSSPLGSLNRVFHTEYAKTRAETFARTRPVLVVLFESLVLLREGHDIRSAPYNPDAYHRYKEVAHVPMATVTILTAASGNSS